MGKIDLKKWEEIQNSKEEKITFKRVLLYFIIYSFLGFVVETIYGALTKGVVESRQSCLIGPFCCIYGLGAMIMIPGLRKFKKSNWGLFIAGAIEGSLVEYVVSWVGEIFFQIKWWDYSNLPLNINGRICILFAMFWGLLALGLMRFINPYIDYLIDKIPSKVSSWIAILGTVFLVLDLLYTAFGLKVFYTKLSRDYNIELKNGSSMVMDYNVLENDTIKYLSNTAFSNERILRTFPNIKFEDKDGNIVWVKDILTDIKPYYFAITDHFRLK